MTSQVQLEKYMPLLLRDHLFLLVTGGLGARDRARDFADCRTFFHDKDSHSYISQQICDEQCTKYSFEVGNVSI